MAGTTEGPNNERRGICMKSNGIASDNLPLQAAASPQDESVAGHGSQTASIQPEALLGRVLERPNLQRALKQVRQNKGAPGIDGMSVDDLPRHLKEHWQEIRAQLVAGTYCPQPVKRVEIPKPDGKKRPLGIPTVVDRFIQQAIAQIISAEWEPHFHPSSYGFRPGRSAHHAVRQVQADIREGYAWVVDTDMEAFFDRVNHDRLMVRLKQHTNDPALLRLINRYLKAGVSVEGSVQATAQGVPQGGPLSPVLANVVLDELDWELERRGHRFARYADDCNIMVKSRRAGERIMASVTRFVSDTRQTHGESAEERGRSPGETQVSGIYGQPERCKIEGGRSSHRQTQRPYSGTDPPHTRPPFGRHRCRAEENPAWLESVLRHNRSAESFARHRQMAAAQITLLHLEAMGKSRLSGTAQTRCDCARSMEHEQERTRPVAPVQNPGAIAGPASEVLQQFGSAISRRMTGICSLNRRVRPRMHGGVGGGGCEAFSYPD